MAAPIDLRNDFDSVSLRHLAKRTRDATQSRRLLALAEVYDGGSRTDASRIGGVGLQIIRDWVLRFNARGPDGLVDGKSPGAPSKLNADHRRALAEVVEAGPVLAVDGVVRWRRKDLARWLLETFAISLDETTVGRELKALGFAKISARPRHYAQNELAVEAFKKNFPAELAKIRARLPKGVEIERGQKNKLTRRWARRGTRPRVPRDQRTEWAYIFGAICPAKGKGAGLVMPWCDTDAMAAHLIEISAAVDPGAHAVLIVDQLAIPDNITVVWQFMRDTEDIGSCIGEGPSRAGGEVNGCEGSAEDVGDCVGYGRVGPRGGGAELRDGPANLARLGVSLQCRGGLRACRTARHQGARLT